MNDQDTRSTAIEAIADVVANAFEGIGVTCPNCAHEFDISINTIVPNSQLIVTKITPSEAAGMFVARAYSNHIESFTKTLKAVAKNSGVAVEVFIKNVTQNDDGSIETVFQVVRNDPRKPK